MQPPTVDAALRDAGSAKVRFRRAAAWVLRDAEGDRREAARTALRGLLRDADPLVRAVAVESLAALGEEKDRVLAAALVDDEEGEVRLAAVDAVADLAGGDPGPLRDLVRHPRADVRARACSALAEFGGEDVERDLAGAAGDREPLVRASAVAALGWFFPRRRTVEIRAALQDAAPAVRLAAADALARILDDSGREVLLRRLGEGPVDDDWQQAFARLARLARPEDRPLLAAHAGWPTRPLRRAVALAGLARLGEPAARDRLRKWLDRRDPQRAVLPLVAVGWVRATEFRDRIARAIERPDSPLFDAALSAAVEFVDAGLAGAIVRAAGATADRGVFEALAAAAEDLARLLGDEAPDELRALAVAEFEPGTGGSPGGMGDG
jgi:HEAT repeat protein